MKLILTKKKKQESTTAQDAVTAPNQEKEANLHAPEHPVDAMSGMINTNDIIFSNNLTDEEASQFVWLLLKAQGQIKNTNNKGVIKHGK